MHNFAKLQKSAKLHKNAILIYMQSISIFMQRNTIFWGQAQHKAQHRNKKCCATDFKGFFKRNKRNMTASEEAQHNPPLPPLGGRGLLRPSRCGFYSHSALMQCSVKIANFCRNDAGGKTEVPVVTQTGGSNQLSKIFHSKK
ncbi:TPA_asm: hypothetical protein GBY29_18535 [Salmonella enterica subsp. diarizonae]|uniref:Uncharacterized protein n=1 Tax=Salmonella diarizonae TaxID=59204 RepID=A0A6Y1UHQ8_SALDZ|nr:hypothetical protein [Salmonella enterica subsp. diarizonae]HCM1917691.1 hypothetical protein [Salmonella enterica subsp. salamae serovar 28:r:e,n,z15]